MIFWLFHSYFSHLTTKYASARCLRPTASRTASTVSGWAAIQYHSITLFWPRRHCPHASLSDGIQAVLYYFPPQTTALLPATRPTERWYAMMCGLYLTSDTLLLTLNLDDLKFTMPGQHTILFLDLPSKLRSLWLTYHNYLLPKLEAMFLPVQVIPIAKQQMTLFTVLCLTPLPTCWFIATVYRSSIYALHMCK